MEEFILKYPRVNIVFGRILKLPYFKFYGSLTNFFDWNYPKKYRSNFNILYPFTVPLLSYTLGMYPWRCSRYAYFFPLRICRPFMDRLTKLSTPCCLNFLLPYPLRMYPQRFTHYAYSFPDEFVWEIIWRIYNKCTQEN